MKTKEQKIKNLEIVAWTTLCAFGLIATLKGEDHDSNMSIVYTKAAMIELGYPDCDIELVMRLFIAAAKAGITKPKHFPPGGLKQVDSLENMKPGEFVIAKPNFKK